MPRSMVVATGVVRTWTRIYTAALSRPVKSARRAEIESDIWEFQRDLQGDPGLFDALHLVVRLLMGVPDDLYWRLEQAPVLGRTSRRLVTITALALLLSAAWLFYLLRTDVLPRPPAAVTWTSQSPPPPPPPPPPCAPPGFTGGCDQ